MDQAINQALKLLPINKWKQFYLLNKIVFYHAAPDNYQAFFIIHKMFYYNIYVYDQHHYQRELIKKHLQNNKKILFYKIPVIDIKHDIYMGDQLTIEYINQQYLLYMTNWLYFAYPKPEWKPIKNTTEFLNTVYQQIIKDMLKNTELLSNWLVIIPLFTTNTGKNLCWAYHLNDYTKCGFLKIKTKSPTNKSNTDKQHTNNQKNNHTNDQTVNNHTTDQTVNNKTVNNQQIINKQLKSDGYNQLVTSNHNCDNVCYQSADEILIKKIHKLHMKIKNRASYKYYIENVQLIHRNCDIKKIFEQL